MKKTFKKYLSLLLAMIMIMSSFAVSASAACNHQIATSDPTKFTVVQPTCTTEGYTLYDCILCGEEGIQRGNPQAALGHKINEYNPQYEVYADGYAQYFICERTYLDTNEERVTCNHKEYTLENGEKAVFYKVNFINNFATADYDSSIAYTKVANSFKNENLYSCFVKKGDAIEYDVIPAREKTAEYAKYRFDGWYRKADIANGITEEKPYNIENAKENVTLYPIFTGLTQDANGEITHEATVHLNPVGSNLVQGLVTQKIAHGNSVVYPYDEPPVKKDDVVNFYEFTGWKLGANATKLVSFNELNSAPIYGNVHIYPNYEKVAKNYTLEFYSWDGRLLKYSPEDEEDNWNYDAIFNGVHLETNLNSYENLNAFLSLAKSTDLLKRESTSEYIYEWTGEFQLPDGSKVNLINFSVGQNQFSYAKDSNGNQLYVDERGNDTGITGREMKKVIRLTPVYQRKAKVYNVTVQMILPANEEFDYPKFGANVQILDPNGQLVASGKTDSNGEYRCQLNYRLPYTITVATSDDKYLGTTRLQYLYEGNTNCRVDMEINPDYDTRCTCICHSSLLRPIWVRILNILYSLFKIKYVCCYDMYSNIGDMLNYTP